jgi:hypothetical protein
MNHSWKRNQSTASGDASPRSDISCEVPAEVEHCSFLSAPVTVTSHPIQANESPWGKEIYFAFTKINVARPEQIKVEKPGDRLQSEYQNVDINHTADGTVVDQFTWEVKQLKPVPLYHPVEPTALILEGLSVDVVVARISNFMRIDSISCFRHVKFSARLDCLTGDMVRFVVQLWRGKRGGSIVVEIHHVQGCMMRFGRLRERLSHALVVADDQANPQGPENIVDNVRASGAYKFVQDATRIAEVDESMEETLDILFAADWDVADGSMGQLSGNHSCFSQCLTMLRSDCFDQNRSAMDSLCTLTDPLQTVSEYADRYAHILIFGNEYGETAMREALTPYLCGVELPNENGYKNAQDSSMVNDDDEQTLLYAKGPFFGAMHAMALRVLAQSLESVAWRKGKSESLPPLDLLSQFWRVVQDALVYNLGVAQYGPPEAALSAKCIRFLHILEPRILHTPDSKLAGLGMCLMNAYQYGRAHHSWLEQECKYLMVRVGL